MNPCLAIREVPPRFFQPVVFRQLSTVVHKSCKCSITHSTWQRIAICANRKKAPNWRSIRERQELARRGISLVNNSVAANVTASVFAVLGAIMTALAVLAAIWMVRHRVVMARLRQANDIENADTSGLGADFVQLENYFRKPVPEDLRWLYGRPDLIRMRGVERRSTVDATETYFIDRFLPESVTSTSFDIGPDRYRSLLMTREIILW